MNNVRLGQLNPGDRGMIARVGDSHAGDITARLMEMGLVEGCLVEVVHQAPFGGDPLAVRVRGALIALRRSEANLIEVVQNEQ